MLPSWPQLLILIMVVVLLFGTKKLRSLGEDLGAAIKGFKKAINDENDNTAPKMRSAIVDNEQAKDEKKE